MNWLEQKYLNILTGRFRNYKRISDRVFNFSCPICGDSKKNKKKARGFVTEKKGAVWYSCHNCTASMPLHRFIEKIDPSLYGEYQKERIVAGLWVKSGSRKRELPDDSQFKTEAPQFKDKVPSVADDPLRFLKRIDTLKETHYARKFCQKRLLPDLTKVFHCPGFYAWTNHIIPGKFKDEMCQPGVDQPRLVIPFFSADGLLIAYQGRSYNESSGAKYITIRIEEDQPKLWGGDTIDHGETVYAFEGPLDAMFVRNAVAFAGGDHSSLTDYDPKSTVIVYDNEPRSPETKHKLSKAIRAGFGIVIWPKHIKEKDVNKMVENGMTCDMVLDILKSNTFRGLSAEAELSNWSFA